MSFAFLISSLSLLSTTKFANDEKKSVYGFAKITDSYSSSPPTSLLGFGVCVVRIAKGSMSKTMTTLS